MTLCLVHEHPRVLLGMKKRGFGAGRWNGFGGKVQEGETVDEAARRELREEAGLEADELSERGILEFEFESDPTMLLEVHIFKIESYSGSPAESEEMRPQWFTVDEIPFGQMWSDDVYWLPLFLKGLRFKGRLMFDKPSTADYQARILEKCITTVDE
jgi:8-oxo-dGTP diphosphatase/2-hydroxy-dATP diphosphatase